MRIVLILSIVIFTVTGCDSGNVQPTPQAPPQEYAESLYESGEYTASAREYLRLSETYPERAIDFSLRAVMAYIEDSALDNAAELLQGLDMSKSDESALRNRRILLAQIAMLQADAETALGLTADLQPDSIDQSMLKRMFTTRANAFVLTNNYFDAALELINLDNELSRDGDGPENTTLIWNYLIESNRIRMDQIPDDHGIMTGWLELASIAKSLLAHTSDLETALQGWRRLNPDHPARDEIVEQLLSTSQHFNSTPRNIALLLPLSGVYERYSERIRDGFLSAWFNERNYKPAIRIYNTDSQDFKEIYNQAVSDGADFIVGPLDKESVRQLAEMPQVPVRTLALNQVDTERVLDPQNAVFPIPELVQFGLPPEDEAKQVAQRGILEGYSRALVITPSNDYGARVYDAFSEEWNAMGGTILEHIEYNSQTSDFVTPIKKLLNIDSSESRISNLRQRLGRNLSSNSRLREDIEFVFMTATNLNARQIVPHLRFFRAEGVPVYTISAVYTGKQNPQVDSDLNGVEFIDMPWLLEPDTRNSPIYTQIQQSWQNSSSIFPRYYAFGIDAFRIISQIAPLALSNNYYFSGQTGDLYMSKDGVVHRNLIWARFENGSPEILFPESGP